MNAKVHRGKAGWIALGVFLLLVGIGLLLAPRIKRHFFVPTASNVPAGSSITQPSATPEDSKSRDSREVLQPTGPIQPITTAIDGLEIPWELAFLPGGDMLVTQRPGTLLRIGKNEAKIPIEGVTHLGEGGLLGVALHPDFEKNDLIYLYFTATRDEKFINRVERYRLEGTTLQDKTVIIDNIPASGAHNGGRLAFGPDGYLYVTTGDAADAQASQSTDTLAGKILRLNEDGSAVKENPFGNATYSYGHRNVQGITWDDQGRVWATEHGPSGAPPESGQDELNLIEPGKNYGWPTITGDETQEGLINPIAHSGISDTWAPSGMLFWDGSIFFAGLRGEAIYEARITGERTVELVSRFKGEYGRLRNIVQGPDGFFYVLTNNTDGRGTARTGDDRILKVDPRSFRQ
jgi:glucose/arabinose dehydrogenase